MVTGSASPRKRLERGDKKTRRLWTDEDISIGDLLADDDAPEEVRREVFLKQLAKVQATRDAINPGWRDGSSSEYEVPEVKDRIYLDGMVRRGHRPGVG